MASLPCSLFAIMGDFLHSNLALNSGLWLKVIQTDLLPLCQPWSAWKTRSLCIAFSHRPEFDRRYVVHNPSQDDFYLSVQFEDLGSLDISIIKNNRNCVHRPRSVVSYSSLLQCRHLDDIPKNELLINDLGNLSGDKWQAYARLLHSANKWPGST